MLPNYDNSAACLPSNYAIPGRLRPPAEARPDVASSIAASVDLNVQIADLLSQRIAVEAEQIRRPDLVAPGGSQRRREQRHLDFLEDAVIEARRRHAIGEPGKMRRQIGFDGAAEIVDAVLNTAARCHGRRRQLAIDDRAGDDVLRI